jgi:hypothetical protein
MGSLLPGWDDSDTPYPPPRPGSPGSIPPRTPPPHSPSWYRPGVSPPPPRSRVSPVFAAASSSGAAAYAPPPYVSGEATDAILQDVQLKAGPFRSFVTLLVRS